MPVELVEATRIIVGAFVVGGLWWRGRQWRARAARAEAARRRAEVRLEAVDTGASTAPAGGKSLT
jgi:hypothetical protein